MLLNDALSENSVHLLDALVRTPFAERGELAAFAGLPSSSALESLLALEALRARPAAH